MTCDWLWFGSEHGRILQLIVTDSHDRMRPWKSSQEIQLDREAAAELLRLIIQPFPELGAVDAE